MTFSNITSNGVTFESRSAGKYVDTALTLAAPQNYLKISPVSTGRKDGISRSTITRIRELEDIDTGERFTLKVAMQISVKSDSPFTETHMREAIEDITALTTSQNLLQIFQGKI